MLNDAGESVLYFDSVHLQEVRDEHLQKASGDEIPILEISWACCLDL